MPKGLIPLLVALLFACGVGWLFNTLGAAWWGTGLGGLFTFSFIFNTIVESTAYKEGGKPTEAQPPPSEGGSE